jgi:hypothetical protein
MESLFTQITPVLEQIGPGGNVPSSVIPKPLSAHPRSEANSSPREPSQSIKVEDDVSESFGQLALDEHGHMRWIGGSSTMSLIQSFRALTSSSPLHRVSPMDEDPNAPGPSANKLYFPASVFFGKVHALPGPEEVEYPDRDLADRLVDAYFSRFHFLMPVIDKPSFLRQYNHLMDNIHDPVLARSETAFMALVFALFACAAQLIDDPRLATGSSSDDGGMGMVYYERALILHYISHASIQISHVQCFILMSSFLCSVNCLPQAWILIGQAVRTGQDLGLHRSPRRLLTTPIEKETRRKVWWGVYSLDRMLALALGRPLGVEDSDCDVEFPVDVDDDDLPDYFSGEQMSRSHPSLMAGFISLTSLYKVAGRVLREVYAIDNCKDQLEPEKKAELQRTVEALDQELTKWCNDLPIVFKSEPVSEKQVSMGAVLCSHYYSVLTTLHRNLLPVKRDQLVAPKSTVKAVSSARSAIRLAPSIKNVVPPSHHLAFFIQHLFSSAVILLLYAMHTEPRAASLAMEEAKSSLTALESWEGQWPGARKCKELLVELTNTANEAMRDAAKPGEDPNVPMPVLPPSSTSLSTERRRSITLPTPSSSAGPGRVAKGKDRRNLSRDATTSSRRHLASPYRKDSQRPRSTSRKRGHDESEGLDNTGRQLYYGNSFSGPNSPAQAYASPHSSPASIDLPSPPMPILDPPQESAQIHLRTPAYNYPNMPLSPVQMPPSPRYEYEYGMRHSPLAQSSSQLWDGNGGEPNGLDMYQSGSQQSPISYQPNSYGGPQPVGESNLYTYDNSQDMSAALSGLSTTPPTSSFAAPGLPFRGLDYIRNYNPGGYSTGIEQDSLWQTYDPGAFGIDPDLPFTLGDLQSQNPDGPA